MRYDYGEYDGHGFQGPDALFPEPQVMSFILKYGEDALDAMNQLEGEAEQQYIQQMIDAGLLEQEEDESGSGKLKLTPKMLKGLQHKALLDIFAGMRRGTREGHETQEKGKSSERTEGTRPYHFGDSLSDLDVGATMRNAAMRQAAGESEGPVSMGLPVNLHPNDFELHNTEGQTDCATVMLIDLSGSMMRFGRFYQAKRVALGMSAMLSTRFPQDTIDFVSFYSLADQLTERDLPLIMPKPVTVRDFEVRIRTPLQEAEQNPEQIPPHFTNLQLGLRKARQILNRRGATNKQIFIITDGQPTAHIEPNAVGGGEMLYLLYPPTERSSTATLKEALRCQQQGMRLATFALIEDYWGMDWVGFVDQLTRLTRGIAYYCTSEDLSSTVIESYLSGKKKKSFIG